MVSVFACATGFFILNDEGSLFASFIAGFCVFITAFAVSFKIIALFFDRHVLEKKHKEGVFAKKIDKSGYEVFDINDDVSITFKPTESAYYDVLPYSDDKTLFYLCDIEGEKGSCDIVRRVTLATLDAVKNSLELEKTMQCLDKSVRLLNMKGIRISVFLGLIDTSEMKISFINASAYNLFKAKKNDISVLMPLSSNKYVLAAEKQLPFIVTEYHIKKNDLISIVAEGFPSEGEK